MLAGVLTSPKKKLLALCITVFISPISLASSFYFPEMNPTVISGDAPNWLKEGNGGDGYITVTSEIIPISSCNQLSTKNFWRTDKTQLVISVVSNGFRKKLDKIEVPIATFDGRDEGSECASLSAAPIQIVPASVLPSYSVFNPGSLSLVVNVKSSNDSNQDFIGSAKLLLGATAMVATGGATAAIGGISSTIGNSVLQDTQAKANTLLKGMIDAKVPILLNWKQLRGGVRTVEVAVFKTEQNEKNLSNKEVQDIQKNSKSEKVILFKVNLTFQYFRSLFYPAVANLDDLVKTENLSSEFILNFQAPWLGENFMKILNSSSPSLLQKVEKSESSDLTRSCSEAFEKLRVAGLNNVDAAIVMKSFIDEAKGNSDWYSNQAYVKSCFNQVPAIQANLFKIYGKQPTTPEEPVKSN